MNLKWQDGPIPGKKLKKPSRTPEEVSQAKKQYEQKRSNEKKPNYWQIRYETLFFRFKKADHRYWKLINYALT
jgi:hypothetical protein